MYVRVYAYLNHSTFLRKFTLLTIFFDNRIFDQFNVVAVVDNTKRSKADKSRCDSHFQFRKHLINRECHCRIVN